MLKKLGRGLMLGGFAKSVRTASYVTTVFIVSLVALMILGFFRREFSGEIVLRFLPVLCLVSFNKYLEYNNCQMQPSGTKLGNRKMLLYLMER